MWIGTDKVSHPSLVLITGSIASGVARRGG
jgi:hypothetical protein